ncbi:hypothetical protein BDF22DRAFT_736126 [Syncephalis plumigaleata]|nr:hypothetical protein BDF22DRAFT_736126 [Syncephalis plumigaleata]
MGCFVLDLPNKKVSSMTAYLNRVPTFELVKNTPRLVARVMEAVSTLNEIGVVYNIMGGNHVWVSAEYKSNIIHDIKLINFGYAIIHKDFRRLVMTNVGLSPSPELAPMLPSFMYDVKEIGQFIGKLLTDYNGLLSKDFTHDPPPHS